MGGGGRDGHRHCCISPKPPVGEGGISCGAAVAAMPLTTIAVPRGYHRGCAPGASSHHHGHETADKRTCILGLAPLSRSPLDLGM